MPFNSSGVFNPAVTFASNTTATAADQNTQDVDIAAGLTQCMTRAGLAPATGNQNLGGFKINQIGAGVAATDAVNLAQAQALIAALFPSGMAAPFFGTAAPAGWLACDGTSYATATYPGLFAAIGYTYGGSGANFNVPNTKGRVLAGLDTAGSTLSFATAVGDTGGEQSHTLVIGEMPAHDHGATTGNDTPDHTHSYNAITANTETAFTGAVSTAALPTTGAVSGGASVRHTHPITAQGGGGAHNNVQPTITVLWCIKT
jgi:microcystin-dependent protein